jgi:hypothetical protein
MRGRGIINHTPSMIQKEKEGNDLSSSLLPLDRDRNTPITSLYPEENG